MIILNFKTWDHKATRFFYYTRIWRKGFIWTPFCKIKIRRKKSKTESIISFDSEINKGEINE